MLQIRKIRTMYGLKYAVVDLFTHYKAVTDKKGQPVKQKGKPVLDKVQEYHAIEYGNGRNTKVAIFPLTDEGLAQAKEVLNAVKPKTA